MEHSIAEAADNERELEGYVAALTACRREMTKELKNFREAKKASELELAQGSAVNSSESSIAGATKAFERIMERQGMAPMSSTGTAKTAAQMQELERSGPKKTGQRALGGHQIKT